MGTVLENGNQVTITTSKNQTPNESWLKLVITGKARAKIRAAMKEQRKRSGILGKEALERKLDSMKVSFNDNIETIVKYFGFPSRGELYYAIATNKFDLQQIKSLKVDQNRQLVPATTKIKSDTKPVELTPEIVKKTQINVRIEGEIPDLAEVHFSSCCNPVPGDKIFAFISTLEGYKIHRINCNNAINLSANYGYRIMKAEWAYDAVEKFVTELLIEGIDTGPGMIEKVSHLISTLLGINIRNFQMSGNGGIFAGNVMIEVANLQQIQQVVDSLKKIDGISSVKRIE